jgi:hypothetical protein
LADQEQGHGGGGGDAKGAAICGVAVDGVSVGQDRDVGERDGDDHALEDLGPVCRRPRWPRSAKRGSVLQSGVRVTFSTPASARVLRHAALASWANCANSSEESPGTIPTVSSPISVIVGLSSTIARVTCAVVETLVGFVSAFASIAESCME